MVKNLPAVQETPVRSLGWEDALEENGYPLQYSCLGNQVALEVKNPPANEGDMRDMGSIPGSERSPGGGHGNPLQYSFLENPTDRGAWWATLHKVADSWT